jgi:hypothetical protein
LTVDGFLNLYAGRWIAEHGIPLTDPFTLVGQGRPWLDQQWLAHLAYYVSWQAGGYAAVALLSALAVAAGFGLLFWLLRGLGATALASCLWSLAALVASLSSVTPRAQVFGFPLFVALLFWLLAEDRSARRWQRWWVVPLVALWGNLHGSVLLAVALVVTRSLVDAFLALRFRRPREAVLHGGLGLAAVAAVMANPYGAVIWDYYVRILTSQAIAGQVSEWQPLDVTDVAELPLLLFMATAASAALWSWHRGRRLRPDLVLLAVLTVGMTFQSGRQEMWAATTLAALAASSWKRAAGRAPPRLVRHSLVAASAAFALLAVTSVSTRPPAGFEQALPRGAVATAAELLNADPTATLLGDESVVLLLWRHPETSGRAAFDIRYEVFPEAQQDSYLGFLAARVPAWHALASKYEVLVVSKATRPSLAKRIARSSGWAGVYSNETGLVATSTG